jgi:hypothetical protein
LSADATPLTKYEFKAIPSRTRPTDAPKSEMLDWTVTAVDGIVPDLPSLGAVSQPANTNDGGSTEVFYGKQDGKFFTRDTTPTFRITGLGADYTGIIAADTNANGVYDPATDADIARCHSEGAQVDCTPSTEQVLTERTIFVASLDPQGNLSQGRAQDADFGKFSRTETLVIEQIAPVATTFASNAATRTVSVTFSEPLARGRNSAQDWRTFLVSATGERTRFTTSAVGGTAATRDLTIAANDPNWVDHADLVIYTFEGLPSAKYQDRAGNYISDTFTL